MRRRVVRLTIVVLGAVLLAAVAAVAMLVFSNPGARQTEDWELLASLPEARARRQRPRWSDAPT